MLFAASILYFLVSLILSLSLSASNFPSPSLSLSLSLHLISLICYLLIRPQTLLHGAPQRTGAGAGAARGLGCSQ